MISNSNDRLKWSFASGWFRLDGRLAGDIDYLNRWKLYTLCYNWHRNCFQLKATKQLEKVSKLHKLSVAKRLRAKRIVLNKPTYVKHTNQLLMLVNTARLKTTDQKHSDTPNIEGNKCSKSKYRHFWHSTRHDIARSSKVKSCLNVLLTFSFTFCYFSLNVFYAEPFT